MGDVVVVSDNDIDVVSNEQRVVVVVVQFAAESDRAIVVVVIDIVIDIKVCRFITIETQIYIVDNDNDIIDNNDIDIGFDIDDNR